MLLFMIVVIVFVLANDIAVINGITPIVMI